MSHGPKRPTWLLRSQKKNLEDLTNKIFQCHLGHFGFCVLKILLLILLIRSYKITSFNQLLINLKFYFVTSSSGWGPGRGLGAGRLVASDDGIQGAAAGVAAPSQQRWGTGVREPVYIIYPTHHLYRAFINHLLGPHIEDMMGLKRLSRGG